MKTFSQLQKEHPKALLKPDVFASYYHDGASEEWLYFKMGRWNLVKHIAKALQQMRVFPHYRIELSEEPWRNGYVNYKFCLRMIDRDEALLPVADVKRITSELFEAMGYQLHWIPINRFLNMKLKI